MSRASVARRVLDAAVELFAEQGFDATSVQEVVERAQVTKGAMYHYFRSKDALLYEIYHELITVQLDGMDRILAVGGAGPRTLRAIIVDLVVTTAAQLGAATVSARELHKLAGEPAAALRAQRRRYHEGVRDLIARGQRDGEFGSTVSAQTATLMVFGIVNQLPQWYRPDGATSPRELADEIAGFVLTGLGARAAEEAGDNDTRQERHADR
ncbi:TetR/AcrR family transcriptional regulator [Rugosimonospora africana]|uniref:TetR/AcrR family transcriptional regulator n=1 Tax=Rugosimonospora africana TaxID=556532 RepID=UPI001945ABE2|nr:TetR/AcrR family transcriptional regulator [Rugosimonospora africana]